MSHIDKQPIFEVVPLAWIIQMFVCMPMLPTLIMRVSGAAVMRVSLGCLVRNASREAVNKLDSFCGHFFALLCSALYWWQRYVRKTVDREPRRSDFVDGDNRKAR